MAKEPGVAKRPRRTGQSGELPPAADDPGNLSDGEHGEEADAAGDDVADPLDAWEHELAVEAAAVVEGPE